MVSCSSEVLLMCDGAAAAPSLLLHWQSCVWALGKRKLGGDEAGLGLAGLCGQHLHWALEVTVPLGVNVQPQAP